MQCHSMQVANRLTSRDSAGIEPQIMQVCDDSGMGMFSVREISGGRAVDKSQVIIKLQENQGYQVSCNCRYFWSFNLYCAHIFSVLNLLQIRTLEKFEPYNRWTKRFHADVYKELYPELQLPNNTPAIQPQPPANIQLGERTLALMQRQPNEALRNSSGIPVDSQPEVNENFDYAMFEKALSGAESGGDMPDILQQQVITAENPEEVCAGNESMNTMIDTSKTRK